MNRTIQTKRISMYLMLSIVAVLSISAKDKEPSPLTKEQKIADFDSLYCTIKDVFPYFALNERENNFDWLAHYSVYKERVANTKNDKEYLSVIDSIMDDLHCGHADLLPTSYYNYCLHGYRLAKLLFGKSYKPYVRELKKNKNSSKYWQSLYKELHPRKNSESTTKKEEKSNIEFEFNEDSTVAIMKIASFSYEYVKKDKQAILDFYQTIKGCDNLIIDIEGNGGGDTRYWQNVLVPYLADRKFKYEQYLGYRDTPGFYKFAGRDDDDDTFPIDSLSFSNLPDEVVSGAYAFIKADNELDSNKKSIQFKGNIYVLADHNVFSSSEAFVNFCKLTGFAKVAGEQTGGDGITTDPFIYSMPVSGIVIRYPAVVGLNPDGSLNAERGSAPDILLKKDSDKTMLPALEDYISMQN